MLLFLSLLYLPRPHQNADHTVVALVASRIENHVARAVGLAHFDNNGPRASPGLGIFESDFAAQVGGIYTQRIERPVFPGADVDWGYYQLIEANSFNNGEEDLKGKRKH